MDLHLLPLIPLYAETHFRFARFLPSLIHRKLPEAIFDMPRRLDPDRDLPVLLLVNDLHEFPVDITDVSLSLTTKSAAPLLLPFPDLAGCEIPHPLASQSRAFLLTIPRSLLRDGDEVFVNGRATLRKGRREHIVINDNLVTSSKAPLRCFISADRLPGREACSYGDLHVHSHYSRSHVEFGPPIGALARLAGACGLDFMSITDHSYDLACTVDNYLREDPALRRWALYHQEMDATARPPVLIAGEEISCLNSRGRAVHLLGIGVSGYLPGSRDGARRNRHFKKDLRLAEVIDRIHEEGAAAFGAHPGARCGLLQRIFLGRGTWDDADAALSLDGLQTVNSGFFASWERGKKLWIRRLLAGQKLALIAGNDAHGDFNRYRSLATPFVQIHEMPDRYLSSVRTGLYGPVTTKRQALDLLKRGATFVSNGPFLSITSSPSPADSVISNTERTLQSTGVFVVARSTHEFGSIAALRVIAGEYGGSERVAFARKTVEPLLDFSELVAPPGSQRGYLRAELVCRKPDGSISQAFTSPCYYALTG